ncbi:hypothetical protein AAHE18_13G269600 [Arachis hypogaea]
MNREENSKGKEVEEEARGEHDHNMKSENRHTESKKVGESKSKQQESEMDGFAGEKEAERLKVLGREENGGGIPEYTVKEKGEEIVENHNREGGKAIDRGKDIIEELGKFYITYLKNEGPSTWANMKLAQNKKSLNMQEREKETIWAWP